ncbi:MAG: cation transporter [Cyanothece sp. SIO1E1]|nr:cation transporter [Cyanothece sp. SIO1E1]
MHHHSSHACSHASSLDHNHVTKPQKTRLLWVALLLIGGFSAVELMVGLFSHSLALLADSGHMVSDCLAIALALFAAWIAQRPTAQPTSARYHPVEVLAALINGLGLIVIAVWIAWEAIHQLQSPPEEILSVPMLMTAILGLGVNSLNAFLLHGDSHDDLNLRGAFLHMVADALGSVGVILAAIAVGAFHWLWADGAVGLFVSILIAVSAIPLVRQSFSTLLLYRRNEAPQITAE